MIDDGLLGRRCDRCTQVRHKCESLDQQLVPHANRCVRAREALAPLVDDEQLHPVQGGDAEDRRFHERLYMARQGTSCCSPAPLLRHAC